MQFYEHRIHEDNRRKGHYDIIPGLDGDMNFSVQNPNIYPDELHMHKIHTDYFAVAKGKVFFRMVREDGQEEHTVLEEKDDKTLIIPPGIWHHYVALEPSILVFYTDRKYDPNDEFRKKIDPAEWEKIIKKPE